MDGTSKFFLSAFLVLLADQLSKHFISAYYPFVKNYGAGFGILQGQKVLLVLVSLFVIAALLYYCREIVSGGTAVFGGLVLGGTLGNLLDRLVLGYVIDFIDLGWWPSFNIADSALTIGVLGLVAWNWLILLLVRENSF